MTRLTTIRHHAPVSTGGVCDVEATVTTTPQATQIFTRCAPIPSATGKNGCLAQSRVLYNALASLLHQLGAGMGDVVVEKAFFRNLAGDYDDFQQVRLQAYRKRGITGSQLPATTYLKQAPCRPGQDIELQAYAIVPALAGSVCVEGYPSPCENISVKLIRIGEARHLYIGNITGHGSNGKPLATFRQQSDAIFDTALRIVKSHGVSFSDVLRTWIYLDDIDRDYADLNESRNAFFEREGVRRLPASTGIGGGSCPRGSLCVADVYALLNPEIARIEVMQTPTLNEAPEYGSSFSRGMKLELPDVTCLFISGTASVDESGATAHVGDVRKQIERMLLNVEELLRAQGATFADLVHAVTYLKSAHYLTLYQEVCADRGIKEVPHTMVEADVCRPELLSEMEAIAILPAE